MSGMEGTLRSAELRQRRRS